jgi:hypothetical protein
MRHNGRENIMTKKSVILNIAMTTLVLIATSAQADQKVKTKSNIKNDRVAASAEPVTNSDDASRKCAAGKHFASVKLTARTSSDSTEASCVADVTDAQMESCTTQSTDWSFGASQPGASASMSAGKAAAVANPHVALCDALQKATMAINADPAALSAVHAKVSMQDMHFVRQMLVDHGVPAEWLGDPDDASSRSSFGWDLKSGTKARTMAGAPATPMQISVDWDQKTNIKVLM